MIIELALTGLTCGGCISAVKQALRRAAPDADVQVDDDNHVARVEAPQLDRGALVAAVEGAGFGVRH